MTMPAVPVEHTSVVDVPWDAGAEEKKIKVPVSKGAGLGMYAWYDPQASDNDKDGYPDVKAGWKFPHHQVNSDGTPGAAVKSGCSAALARLDQADVPAADKAAIKAHVQAHLDDFAKEKGFSDWSAYVSQHPEEAAVDAAEEERSFDLSRDLAALELSFAALAGCVWAVRPEVLLGLDRMSSASPLSAEMFGARSRAQADGPVRVVSLKGLITPQPSFLSLLFGGSGGGLAGFTQEVKAAAADPECKAIVLDVDSPGGLVDGVPEAAAEVRQARAQKPMVAVANTQASSAAYWLASQAHELAVSPSGQLGSIGVYQLHRDMSEAHAMRGIAPTLISAGKYKVEGNPYEALSEEARQAIQTPVNDFYGMFVKDVATGRGTTAQDVEDGYGQGRQLTAKRAVSAGLADRVATLGQTIARLSSGRAKVRQVAGEAADAFDPTDAAEYVAEAVDYPVYTQEEKDRLLTTMVGLR